MCPRCWTVRQFQHKLYKRFFTLYYIPLYPVNDEGDYVECTACHCQLRPEVLQMPALQVAYKQRHPLMQGYGIVGAILAAVIIVLTVSNTVQAEASARRDREVEIARASTRSAMLATYGEANFQRCNSNLPKPRQWVIPRDAHLIMLNEGPLEIWEPYQQQLPTQLRAISQQDLTHVVCLAQSVVEFDRSEYGKEGSDVAIYTCTRYMRYIDAYVISTKTGSVVAYRRFRGSLPEECPDKTKSSLTYYGENPTPTDIVGSLRFDSGPSM
ncbi:MAG: hypothetical protein IT324_22825 [Anaerolineae bacterium]|nr:hypothetical protein [Anaerolineae bacterium]